MSKLIFGLILIQISIGISAAQGSKAEVYQERINKLDELEHRLKSPSKKSAGGDLHNYFHLNEISKELLKHAPEFHEEVLDDLEKERPLYGAQLTLLHKIVGVFISLDYRLHKLSQSTSNKVLKVLGELERYDNVEMIYLPFYKEKDFRRLVNAEDRSYDVERKELKKTIRSMIKRRELKSVREVYEDFKKKVHAGELNINAPYAHATLNHRIVRKLQEKKYWRKWRRRLFGQTLSDFGHRVGSNIVHHMSGAFGNGAGSIRWRKGYLWQNQKITEEIFNQLKPLDVITEKVSYTPTDFFIPGHFGHNAIWLGTPNQLKEMGLWDHPIIKPYQKEIQAGKSIIETDRSGTHFKSLEKFMNVDEFGLLRFRHHILDVQNDRRMVLKIYEVAFAQLGKTYDFNFDVETTDKLVCSELLYQSFGHVNWPTEPYLGRTTISPDNVVSLALFDNPPLDLIYYVKGTKENEIVYKDIEDLASDVGFKNEEGRYKKPVKVCRNELVRRPGTRGREMINRRKCETHWEDLNYVPHEPVPDLSFAH